MPALRVTDDWVISDPWTPSDVPLAEMSLALAHAAKLSGADLDADRCQQLLTTAGGMADYVRALREAGHGSADTKVLVVVDQAEELVTITPEAERRAFLEALTTSCTAPVAAPGGDDGAHRHVGPGGRRDRQVRDVRRARPCCTSRR